MRRWVGLMVVVFLAGLCFGSDDTSFMKKRMLSELDFARRGLSCKRCRRRGHVSVQRQRTISTRATSRRLGDRSRTSSRSRTSGSSSLPKTALVVCPACSGTGYCFGSEYSQRIGRVTKALREHPLSAEDRTEVDVKMGELDNLKTMIGLVVDGAERADRQENHHQLPDLSDLTTRSKVRNRDERVRTIAERSVAAMGIYADHWNMGEVTLQEGQERFFGDRRRPKALPVFEKLDDRQVPGREYRFREVIRERQREVTRERKREGGRIPDDAPF